MPVKIKKTKSGKFQVKTPGGVKAKGTTKAKAVKQKKLLNAVEHGFRPTGRDAMERAMNKMRKSKKKMYA